MIIQYICPFCGDAFFIGYDPIKNKKYDENVLTLIKYKSNDIINNKINICNNCYLNIKNNINRIERRNKNEQPKFP